MSLKKDGFITSKCPTPGCKGELCGDSFEDGFSCNVPSDGFIPTRNAVLAKDKELSCPACGATATVRADEPEQVRVWLGDVKTGDTSLTTPILRLRIRFMSAADNSWRASYDAVAIRPDLAGYLDYQGRAGVEGDEPVNFEFVEGETRYIGRAYYVFKER
jgi:hypothetical protein